MLRRTVSQTFVVAGSIDTFDRDSFRQRLATTLNVPPSRVELVLSAASVRIDATVLAVSDALQAA